MRSLLHIITYSWINNCMPRIYVTSLLRRDDWSQAACGAVYYVNLLRRDDWSQAACGAIYNVNLLRRDDWSQAACGAIHCWFATAWNSMTIVQWLSAFPAITTIYKYFNFDEKILRDCWLYFSFKHNFVNIGNNYSIWNNKIIIWLRSSF